MGSILADMNTNGVTVVPREPRRGVRFFVIRFRWVEPGLWAKWGRRIPQMTPVASSSEFMIHYCPRCGASTDAWIRDNDSAFSELLAQVVD